jgi:hypothetical protein
VSEHALRAAARATLVLEETANLPVSVIVGQVRAAAVDLLRSWGLERDDAESMVRDAAASLAADDQADRPAHAVIERCTASSRNSERGSTSWSSRSWFIA